MRKPKGSWIFQRELKYYIGKIRVKLKPPVDWFALKYVIQKLKSYQTSLLLFTVHYSA